MRTLIRDSHVLTLDPRQSAIANGGVLIEGERIIAVDTVDALTKSPGIERELGTDDTWIMPGFVNAHYHHDRVFSMGSVDCPLELWLLRGSGLDGPSPEEADNFNYLNTMVSASTSYFNRCLTKFDFSFFRQTENDFHQIKLVASFNTNFFCGDDTMIPIVGGSFSNLKICQS